MSEVKVTESTYNTELLMQNFKFDTPMRFDQNELARY